MSSTNSGPSVTTTPNVVVQAVPAGSSSVPFDPSSVAITGGTIGGKSVSTIASSARLSLNDYSASNPLYIAHRGSDALYPEESTVAYNRSLADGEVLLECDVATLSDGALGLMHDGTVDRTTTGTGNVNTFTTATFKALTMDSSVWLGSNYGDTLNPMLFQEFVDAYKARGILVPEDKDSLSMTALVRALLNSGVAFDQALIQCSNAANLPTAVNAGYQALGLSSAGSPTPAAIAGTGAKYAAISNGDTTLASYVAAGLKTLVYTVNRRYLRDQFLAQGAVGFFSDDPVYLRGTAATATTDSFARQTWVPGMVGSDSSVGQSVANRGYFSAPNFWGYPDNSVGYKSCLHGYLGPLANPSNFTMTFNVIYDSAFASNYHFGIYMGINDMPYQNGADSTQSGYYVECRPSSGLLRIMRKDPGVINTQLKTQSGTALTVGTEYTFRLTVTPTTITFAIVAGGLTTSVTFDEAIYRGPYIHIGRDGVGFRMRYFQVA